MNNGVLLIFINCMFRFTDDYFNQKINRGYGTHVRTVFSKLKESNYEDVFKPAKEQFNGSGSFGNGGAMRMAPIALFGNSRGEEYLLVMLAYPYYD